MRLLVAIAGAVILLSALADAATIKGKISPPGRCRAIRAVDRKMLKSYHGRYDIGKAGQAAKEMSASAKQAALDTATGEFTLSGLLPGTYDLVLDIGEGVIEGVNLKLDPDDDNDPPPAEADEKKDYDDEMKDAKLEVLDYISKSQKDFYENKVRGLCVEGNRKHCKALMLRIRDKSFHADGGAGEETAKISREEIYNPMAPTPPGTRDVTWRAEVWIFDNKTGAWIPRGRSGVDVVIRERLKADLFKKELHVFDPKIGGIRLKKDSDEVKIEYTIPDKITAEMGKVPE